MRWLYHLLPVAVPLATAPGAPYAPASLAVEGFVHCSYRDAVAESARLYFPPDLPLSVLQIDPRLIAAPIEVAHTPRGPMPHVHGPIPAGAIRARLTLPELHDAPDLIEE